MKQRDKDDLEKRSVSAPPDLFAHADKKMKDRMMTNFSEYVRDLIRRDAEGKLPTAPAQQHAHAA